MIINSEHLTMLYQGWQARFQKGLASNQDDQSDVVATKVSSTTKTENYGMLGEVPNLREWLGQRQVHKLIAAGYAITNRDFETSWSVGQNDIEDDNLAMFGNYAELGGEAARMWPHQTIYEMWQDGDTTVCYDAQNFFDTDHPVGRGADEASVSNLFDDGGVNAAHPFYLIDNRRLLKPVIWQLRKAPEFVSRMALDSDNVFYNREFEFGIDARGNAGFGLWQCAARCEGALSEANLRTYISTMKGYTNDEGRLLGINPLILLVPTYHVWDAIDLVKAMYSADDATGKPVQVRKLQVIEVPELP